jgi:hypothetical protein
MGYLANGLFVVCVIYFIFTCNEFYGVFYPPECQYISESEPGSCILPAIKIDSLVNVKITAVDSVNGVKYSEKLLEKSSHPMNEEFSETVNVTVTENLRNNGSLRAMIEIIPVGEFSWSITKFSAPLTHYAQPVSMAVNLMSNSDTAGQTDSPTRNLSSNERVSHLRHELSIAILSHTFSFNPRQVPPGIARSLRLKNNKYLPIWTADQLSLRAKKLLSVDVPAGSQVELLISYNPVSIGKYNLIQTIEESISGMKALGFNDNDLDDVKSIFTDTNFFLLILTVFVSVFHILFDILAFKNDISFWRNKKDMVGLSMTGVLWRFVSHFIIMIYLFDQDTSKLILLPMVAGTIIEFWKVTKAFKVQIIWPSSSGKAYPVVTFGGEQNSEKETNSFDSTALYYLSFVLIPLVIGGAIYSLIYVPHKSIYSWIIQSLVNGVYAFGFLFMMPQLFVNYKLKSVAHLPWRAFMYKAFNTFIDDIFAFIITMPAAHRLACFRDDIVFVIYLYQRYLYPVDKTRVNEYGQQFDEDDKNNSVEDIKPKGGKKQNAKEKKTN